MNSAEDVKILIVDDDANARSTLKQMLATLGITNVLEAATNQAAMEFIESDDPEYDMILCEWNMSGINGVEVLSEVRKNSTDFPFLMVTGRSDLDSVMEAKKEGVTGYIVKPFSIGELKGKISKVLDISL